ncbi:MAG: hypothetical protein R2726_07165 [Acidimicrobiales bacterium]
MLDDGTYDAFVVDAHVLGEGSERETHLELTVTDGAHKGEVVEITGRGLRGDELDLLGMPATITVVDGVPRVRIDG